MASADTDAAAGPVRVATIGAAFSANKGAASMVQAIVDSLPERLVGCQIDVLTTYPSQDREEKPDGPVRIVSLKPRELVFPVLPLAIIVRIVRFFGGSGASIARLHPALASLQKADVVLDLAGISFADGRGFPILVYNVLMTGVPLLVGAPVIKCSQAIGPFPGGLNRRAARFVLPRLEAVLTRGAQTHEHALDLGLANAERADDLAFLMHLPSRTVEHIEQILRRRDVRKPFITIAPSAVVRSYCDDNGIDYVGMLARFIRQLRNDHDTDVVIVPHSARPGQKASRMNDLPVCADLHFAIGADERVHLVQDNLRPAQLRAVIAAGEALVTSRFHAMISALATATPVLVVGWSHKYEEVLSEFGLAEHAMPYSAFTAQHVGERFETLWDQRDDVRQSIHTTLPQVTARATNNIDMVVRVLARR